MFAYFGYLGILKVSIVLAILCAGLVVALAFFRRRPSRESEPSCGKCGYLVQGLTTFTCPECGSDLREVGIVTGETRRPLSPMAKSIIWTLALPFPALLLSGLIIAIVPLEYRTADAYSYKPLSRAYSRVTLSSASKGPSPSQTKVEKVALRLKLNPSTASQAEPGELTLDPTSMGYRYMGQDGRPVEAPNGFDAHVILDWMTAAGVNVEDPAVRKETGELFAKAQGICGGVPFGVSMPSFMDDGGSGKAQSGPPLWLTIALLTFWPLLWLLGLWRITRRKPQPGRASK